MTLLARYEAANGDGAHLAIAGNCGSARLPPGPAETLPAVQCQGLLRSAQVSRELDLVLLACGDITAARDLAADLRQHWRERHGDDHETTLAATLYPGWALRDMGRYARAREPGQDTLTRSRRVLGDDHRDTLAATPSPRRPASATP